MELEQDPLYPDAVRVVVKTQNVSISALQRVLIIGYNRAARLIETMEAAGVVTVPDDHGKRRVLTTEVSA